MDDYEKYLNYAIRFLSFRMRSEKEIIDYLKKKNSPEEVSAKVIGFLKEHKFINDEEFARLWVSSRKNSHLKSKRIIKIELLRKGVDQEIIDKTLVGDGEEEGVDDRDQARKLIRSRISRYGGLSKQELYQKLGGFLSRRGFGWETIKKSIDEEIKEVA